MSTIQPPPLPPPSVEEVVRHAQRIVDEYRLLATFDEELHLPIPAPWEEPAYRVLLSLGLLNSVTQQWSTLGQAFLQRHTSGVKDMLAERLGKTLCSKTHKAHCSSTVSRRSLVAQLEF